MSEKKFDSNLIRRQRWTVSSTTAGYDPQSSRKPQSVLSGKQPGTRTVVDPLMRVRLREILALGETDGGDYFILSS